MKAVLLFIFLFVLVGCSSQPAMFSPLVVEPTTTVVPPPYSAFLPLVMGGNQPSSPTIIDCSGAITDTAWLTSTFGAVSWTQGTGPQLSALQCSIGPAVLVVHVDDESGLPVENQIVVLYWPDAPQLPESLWNCGLTQGVYGPTNFMGDIGFGLGPGSYYWPPDGGPHVIWLAGGDSDCLSGLGMVAATDHQHLNSSWIVPDYTVTIQDDLDFYPVTYTDVIGRQIPVIILPDGQK